MIVDDSFYSLKEQMKVHDSFSASGLVKDRLKPHSNPKWLPRCCQLQTNRVTILTKVITRRVHVCGTFFAMITTIGMLLEKQRRTTGKLESKKHCIKFTLGYVFFTVPCKCKLTVPRSSNFETRSSIIDPRSFRVSRFESSASSIESSASSFETRNKELFA